MGLFACIVNLLKYKQPEEKVIEEEDQWFQWPAICKERGLAGSLEHCCSVVSEVGAFISAGQPASIPSRFEPIPLCHLFPIDLASSKLLSYFGIQLHYINYNCNSNSCCGPIGRRVQRGKATTSGISSLAFLSGLLKIPFEINKIYLPSCFAMSEWKYNICGKNKRRYSFLRWLRHFYVEFL